MAELRDKMTPAQRERSKARLKEMQAEMLLFALYSPLFSTATLIPM